MAYYNTTVVYKIKPMTLEKFVRLLERDWQNTFASLAGPALPFERHMLGLSVEEDSPDRRAFALWKMSDEKRLEFVHKEYTLGRVIVEENILDEVLVSFDAFELPTDDNPFVKNAIRWLTLTFEKAAERVGGETVQDAPAGPGEPLPDKPKKPGEDGWEWDDVFDWKYRVNHEVTLDDLVTPTGCSSGHIRRKHSEYTAQYGKRAKPDNESRFGAM